MFHEAIVARAQMKVVSNTSGNDSPSMPTRYLMLKDGIQSASCTICTTPKPAAPAEAL
jgi:hypothetical protein